MGYDTAITIGGLALLAYAAGQAFKGGTKVFAPNDTDAPFSSPTELQTALDRKGFENWHSGTTTFVRCGDTLYSIPDADVERTTFIKRRLAFTPDQNSFLGTVQGIFGNPCEVFQ